MADGDVMDLTGLQFNIKRQQLKSIASISDKQAVRGSRSDGGADDIQSSLEICKMTMARTQNFGLASRAEYSKLQ